MMAVLACGWTTDVSARTPPLNANPAGGNVGAASRSTLNRRPAQRKTLFDGPPTEGSGNVGGGNDGQAWSYVLGVGPNGTVWARSAALAAVEFTGKPSSVINRCIAALPHSGGTLFLRAGVYTLESPIVIDRSSVELRGENAGGDLFFASDSYYNGFRNKTATVLVAEGIDAIQVGNGMVSPSNRLAIARLLGALRDVRAVPLDSWYFDVVCTLAGPQSFDGPQWRE